MKQNYLPLLPQKNKNNLNHLIIDPCIYPKIIKEEGYGVMVFNGTFNNILVILWNSVLLVEENGVLGENH